MSSLVSFCTRLYSTQPRILVTGALGQLGTAFIPFIKAKQPKVHMIATDIKQFRNEFPLDSSVQFQWADVMNRACLESIIVTHNINTVIHFSALLSAIGEQFPQRALDIGIQSVHHILELAKTHALRVFIPSTIGAFGPTTPKNNTPDLTIMRPTTIYGITKLHMELMGEYYHARYGVDFRSVRLPGVLSLDTPPGGGTTDYAVHMLQAAAKATPQRPITYTCFLSEDTRLPMMHINDTMKGLYDMVLTISSDRLKQRVYNMGAMDFTPLELATAIQKKRPYFKVIYQPDSRQAIADTWPAKLDDGNARRDWDWSHQYEMDALMECLATGCQ